MENKITLIAGVHVFTPQTFIWHLLCGIWQVAVIFFLFLISNTLLSTLPSYHFSLAVN